MKKRATTAGVAVRKMFRKARRSFRNAKAIRKQSRTFGISMTV